MAKSKAQLMTAAAAHDVSIAPRIAARHARVNARLVWYGEQVAKDIKIPLMGRVKLAAQLLRDKVVANVSRPVFKYKKKLTRGPRKGQTVTKVLEDSRSKPGEFPKAETSTLMRNIVWQMESTNISNPIAQVLVPEQIQRQSAAAGAKLKTTLDYALALETSERLDRSFMLRTFNESEPILRNVITGRPL